MAAPDLGAISLREKLKRPRLAPGKVQGGGIGNVMQAGAKMSPARQVAIAACLPVEVPAFTGNRVRGSVNVEGDAIALGHPIGATGAVLARWLMFSMRRDGWKRGAVTLCIGGGKGIALALGSI